MDNVQGEKDVMKKGLGIFVLLMAVAVGSQAQETKSVFDARQKSQHTRIRQGWTEGDLTRGERARLRAEQRHIRRAKGMARAEGSVTRMERMRLHRAQQRASRDIFRQRHDMQSRMH